MPRRFSACSPSCWSRSTSSAASSSPSACWRCTRKKKRSEEPAAMPIQLTALLYLVSSVLFILALRGLSSPETSRKGNTYGMVGMAIAILTTIANLGGLSGTIVFVVIALVIGGSIGAVLARRIQMTAMPQLVAAMHSLVGLDRKSTRLNSSH